jgi:hypothetical protein
MFQTPLWTRVEEAGSVFGWSHAGEQTPSLIHLTEFVLVFDALGACDPETFGDKILRARDQLGDLIENIPHFGRAHPVGKRLRRRAAGGLKGLFTAFDPFLNPADFSEQITHADVGVLLEALTLPVDQDVQGAIEAALLGEHAQKMFFVEAVPCHAGFPQPAVSISRVRPDNNRIEQQARRMQFPPFRLPEKRLWQNSPLGQQAAPIPP